MPDDTRSTQIQEQDPTVAKHARHALDAAGGDIAQAAALLEQAVRKDKALWKALLDPLVAYACREAVLKQQREKRDRIWNPPSVDRPGITNEARARILAASNLLMFPLPIGKTLGDATRGEIIEASELYRKQSKDMAHKARWLSLVLQSVPAGKQVKHVLTHERLRELQQEARDAE